MRCLAYEKSSITESLHKKFLSIAELPAGGGARQEVKVQIYSKHLSSQNTHSHPLTILKESNQSLKMPSIGLYVHITNSFSSAPSYNAN